MPTHRDRKLELRRGNKSTHESIGSIKEEWINPEVHIDSPLKPTQSTYQNNSYNQHTTSQLNDIGKMLGGPMNNPMGNPMGNPMNNQMGNMTNNQMGNPMNNQMGMGMGMGMGFAPAQGQNQGNQNLMNGGANFF